MVSISQATFGLAPILINQATKARSSCNTGRGCDQIPIGSLPSHGRCNQTRRCWTRRTPRCASITRAVCCDSAEATAENTAQNLGLTALKATKTPWQGANGTERSTPETASGPPVPGPTLSGAIAVMNLRDIAVGTGGRQSRSPLLLEPAPIRGQSSPAPGLGVEPWPDNQKQHQAPQDPTSSSIV